MRIGVSIDGVLRDFLNRVEEVYEKYFLKDEDSEIKIPDYNLEKWLDFPEEEVKQAEMVFNPEFDEDSFLDSEEEASKLENKIEQTTLEEFLYEKCTLEIFGYANETVSSAVETLNKLILDNPKHEFILISREGGMAIPSTQFFLAKTKSTCPNIKFVTEYSKVWDYVDVMVTDHPKIINTKPNDKISVIIDKEYNKEFNQNKMRFKTIKEIDSDVLDKVESILNYD
jgi:hypothetical protein